MPPIVTFGLRMCSPNSATRSTSIRYPIIPLTAMTHWKICPCPNLMWSALTATIRTRRPGTVCRLDHPPPCNHRTQRPPRSMVHCGEYAALLLPANRPTLPNMNTKSALNAIQAHLPAWENLIAHSAGQQGVLKSLTSATASSAKTPPSTL